ncbi:MULTISPECIES: dipeptide ABC transporter ATP-binding protein [unclassified Pseudomonas]|uniref:dipeptide ABC transporter ATP-binding protein n=1 Tax=unclassified Pseudomonas TaxID=196821 RepID=UPI001BCA8FB7|nr:ABC transporter ATP-binding protein [Pseudomonas sp. Pc102]BBP83450.1 ABC transporter ATP-binding protein [Pseudomonas sp. Pc102]
MSGSLLDIRGLSVRLPAGASRTHAFTDLDLRLDAGELLCVVGESGSGKSTLGAAILRLLAPELTITSGSLAFAGQELLHLDERAMTAIRGSAISLVSQEPLLALNPVQRIGVQIEESLLLHTTLTRHERRARVTDLLAYVGLPDPQRLRSAYPFQLSGGQRQRVAIAIALASEPRLLVADEVTSALDAGTREHILALLQRIQRDRGMAVLLITHDFAVVSRVADRVLVMEAGRVVEQGAVAQVLHAPRSDYTRRLLGAAMLRPRAPRPIGSEAPLLQVRHLKKQHWRRQGFRRHGITALQQVSFELRGGETLGIVGESGSGKSTLARTLLGLSRADSGSIRLDGQELVGLDGAGWRAIRSHIQMVFQDPGASFNPRRRIGAALIAGPVALGIPRAEAEQRARSLLERVGLQDSAFDAYPHSFSGGQRQRIAIARALMLHPRVLVADECVSALDALVQAQVLDLLEGLQRELGLALIFITHDLGVAARISDRLLVMQHGQVVEQGASAQVLTQPNHPYTRTLLSACAAELRPPLRAAVGEAP